MYNFSPSQNIFGLLNLCVDRLLEGYGLVVCQGFPDGNSEMTRSQN